MVPGTRVVVDIGGSGARVAQVTPTGQVADIRRARIGSRSELLAEMDRYGSISWLGLSVPGVVRMNDGHVMRSAVAPWLVGSIRNEIARELECNVDVVNDGCAHALGMTAIRDLELGAICVALGTSVGFGALAESGELVQTLSGTSFEVGDIRLHTSASTKEAWWAVGQPGLEELEQAHGSASGRERFAYRVGAFAKTLTIALQPGPSVSLVDSSRDTGMCWSLQSGPSFLDPSAGVTHQECSHPPASSLHWTASLAWLRQLIN